MHRPGRRAVNQAESPAPPVPKTITNIDLLSEALDLPSDVVRRMIGDSEITYTVVTPESPESPNQQAAPAPTETAARSREWRSPKVIGAAVIRTINTALREQRRP